MSGFLKILTAILGPGEQIVPIFVHNPRSQQIEAVVVSTLPGVINVLSGQTQTSASKDPQPAQGAAPPAKV